MYLWQDPAKPKGVDGLQAETGLNKTGLNKTGPNTSGHTMDKLDFRKTDAALYAGKVGRFDRVSVPPMPFLMVDGIGDPNRSPAYAQAITALYGLSYGLKFAAKADLGHDHVVGPLEGLWWADDIADFVKANRDRWRWTMMIRQPDWITADLLTAVRARLLAKASEDPGAAPDTLNAVRLGIFAEGECLQTLHLGSYADEAPVIARLHRDELPERGLRPTGRHHEIYLNDPRHVPPERLRTILRQPVAPAD